MPTLPAPEPAAVAVFSGDQIRVIPVHDGVTLETDIDGRVNGSFRVGRGTQHHITPEATFRAKMSALGMTEDFNLAMAEELRHQAALLDLLYYGPDRIGRAHAWGTQQAAKRLLRRAEVLDAPKRPEGAEDMEAMLTEAEERMDFGLDDDELTRLADFLAAKTKDS